MSANVAYFYIRKLGADSSEHRIGIVRLEQDGRHLRASFSVCNEADKFDPLTARTLANLRASKSNYVDYVQGFELSKKSHIDWIDAFELLKSFNCPALDARLNIFDYHINADYLAGALKHLGLREKVAK